MGNLQNRITKKTVSRIPQELSEYKSRHDANNDFYISDFKAIYDISDGDIFSLIEKALKIGYVRGYNRAEREAIM